MVVLLGSYDFFGLNCYTTERQSDNDVPIGANGGRYDMVDVGTTSDKDPSWPK